MKPKVSVLVQTCDNYSHFWEGWYVMFNEERDFPYQDDRIKQLKTGKSKQYWGIEEREWIKDWYGKSKQIDEGWSDRLIYMLENVDTDYIFY